MKTLVVAEKPSVARDIARVMGVSKREEGYLSGADAYVTWALGHLITLCEPDELDEKYKKWRMDALPILPDTIPLKVVYKTRAQFGVIKKLMNAGDVDQIICATDSGREGELIFRYIYAMAKCVKPVKRLWISSMTDEAIRAGLNDMRPARAYDALYLSAKCRSEADWLVGMNASRAYSLRFGARLSVGRVQTPTLALIVKRDIEIAEFVPEDYWEISANFGDYKGLWLDPDTQKTRCASKEAAEKIKSEVSGGTGEVVQAEKETKRKPPEKLYDLTTLQREANRKHGYSADKTLSIAQALYETHKLITYPRTDSRYLPDDMLSKTEKTLKALPEPYAGFVNQIKSFAATKRVYDNAKISDHHAIVPTEKRPNLSALKPEERNIYDMVARRLIAAHFPDYLYAASKIITRVNAHMFKTTGATTLDEGWRALYRDEKQKDDEALPDVKAGDRRKVTRASVRAQKTKPPAPHTDDTLLKCMEDAGRQIEDDALREQMKDAGLGTPATRAAIITRLITVGYVKRSGKTLVSTEKGRLLISIAPAEITGALTTGKWERALTSMARLTDEGVLREKEARFMDSIRRFSIYLVDSAKNNNSNARFPDEARRAPAKGAVKTNARASKRGGKDGRTNGRGA